jgi:5-formyltetrahydrofolate cyclo-ligase
MDRDKEAVRERARAIRCRLTPAEISQRSEEIERHLLEVINGEDPVMVYASKPGEVDTRGLIGGLLSRGISVVVPIIEQETRTLRLSFLRDPAVLVPGTFSVPEPLGAEIPADPEEISLVVVPMMAFDRRGFRLGYGAGYYDRFLSDHPRMKKIGVAFSCLELEEVPADRYDVPMDVIVTEEGVIEIPPRKP